MTYEDFVAMLSSVREDHRTCTHSRSLVRQFDFDEEAADAVCVLLGESFFIASLTDATDVVGINYFTIGVDMGRKLAEAEHLQAIVQPEEG